MMDAAAGCVLGTAVGDAVGLVCEGLPRARQRKLYPGLHGPRLVGRRGMVSDDTEHTLLVAEALAASKGEPDAFTDALAGRLRRWILTVPAGAGWATLRACLRLCAGIPPSRSGVFSAGNGPAMRSALIGVCCGGDTLRLVELVRRCTRVTHTDPKAEAGALAVAVAASVAADRLAGEEQQERFLEHWRTVLSVAERDVQAVGLELTALLERAVIGQEVEEFADTLCRSGYVSGYIFETVPAAIHAWLAHPQDVRAAVLAAVRCGGDTDTVAAITGAIVGAEVGAKGIPEDWLRALAEWPRTVEWMSSLAGHAADAIRGQRTEPVRPLPLWALLMRNALFAGVVIAHGLRRLLPPY